MVHTGRHPWTAPGGVDRIEVTADGEAALPARSQYLPLAPQAPSPSGRRSLPQPKPAGDFAGFAACAPNPANSPVHTGWRANNCRRCNLMATAFELTGGRALADVAGPLRAMGSWLGSLGLDDPEEVVETFAVWLATTMPWFFPEDRALEMVGDFVGLEKQEEAMMALMEEQMKREKKLKAASLREGRREGRQEGRAEAQVAMLRRLARISHQGP